MEVVAIRKISEGRIADAIGKAVADVGGISRYVREGARVVIKPNLLCALDWRTGTTTNPAVVEAIAHLAWEAGAADIIIGEASGVGNDTSEVFRALGYEDVARRCSARLVDLNQDPVEVDWPSGVVINKIPISKTALEADVLINVPVMKTHCQTVVTVSLKNMKGVMHSRGKRKLHFLGLEQGIVDLNRAIAVHLVIVDGMIGQEGAGPVAGDPVEMNLILAGANRVAVDAVSCRVMGIDPETVPHIQLASEASLGPLALEEIAIRGETVESVTHSFKLPTFNLDQIYAYEGLSVIEGTACSGCTGSLALALKTMKESGELAKMVKAVGHVSVVFGEDAGVPEDCSDTVCLYVGKCQRKSKDLGAWVPGCPPSLDAFMDVLREATGFQRMGLPALMWQDKFEAQNSEA